ncbi:MAG: holo-ACP synthase [Rickettsiales bacterium]|nr:holo-ACP synthase [Rickettsiales bacterium]
MILGIGIDLVKVDRIKKLYFHHKDKFVLKILSSSEIEEIKNMRSEDYIIQYLAKRFAAKEALVKAIGTGFAKEVIICDIAIKNDKRGKPYYHLSNKLDLFIKKLFKTEYSLHLSISDDKENAIATALIETFNDSFK